MIPRMGKRIDNVLIHENIVFLLEFKVGENSYHKHSKIQVLDYALDLINFHSESEKALLVPILVATNAHEVPFHLSWIKNNLTDVVCCNSINLKETIHSIISTINAQSFPLIDSQQWIQAIYRPTPTIIEAAQVLYQGHNVKDISRNDASAENLTLTTSTINSIIDESKQYNKKSICFITGVPGAGKTLAGLNIANERHKFEENEHAVFLSGNMPLVTVLQEALARDEVIQKGCSKADALRHTKAFIQMIHHFRDSSIGTNLPPIEKVAIFDEAQRAWNAPALKNFMKTKKGIPDFEMSEPECLIAYMDRHPDWSVIICLVGGGQEINTGEAGIAEWFSVLNEKFPHWDVYVSSAITDVEYLQGRTPEACFLHPSITYNSHLHLAVSLRSFRSESLSSFVKAVLDMEGERAQSLLNTLKDVYPIAVTRDLAKAKDWVKKHAAGSERYGMISSSGARRLRSHGVWVQAQVDAKNWFLNGSDDIRSSYFLEEVATEFDIQGLELDWSIVCWDANLRIDNHQWAYYEFKGSRWNKIQKQEKQLYLKNAYRVLLTRAR